jgi:nucleoside phosphorylase
MLNEEYFKLKRKKQDVNNYILGRIGIHNVAIICLSAGLLGNGSAAIVAKDIMRSFLIKFGLIIGIGGGVWNKKTNLRFGNIVVS